MFRKKFKKEEKRLKNSFYHAYQGIITGFKEEKNMKIHYFMMILVLIAGIIFKISFIEWIICFILFALVISLELVNTAIEATVDLVTKNFNIQAKKAKDTAAGAVLLVAIFSALIGFMIFIPKVLLLFKNGV